MTCGSNFSQRAQCCVGACAVQKSEQRAEKLEPISMVTVQCIRKENGGGELRKNTAVTGVLSITHTLPFVR